MYHRLGTSCKVLVVGPLIGHPQPGKQRTPAARSSAAAVLTWSLIGVIFASIALWFWVRPVWRDLESLRQTARDLGETATSKRRRPVVHTQHCSRRSTVYIDQHVGRVRQLLATTP
jgi:two-component system sensor histidine kinase RstB